MTFHRPRRWSDLSRVERVDVYTRQSLYLLLWCSCAALIVAGVPETSGSPQQAGLVIGGIAVTALGTLVMHRVMPPHPAVGAFPRGRTIALLLVSAVFLVTVGLTSHNEVRGTVAVLIAVNVCGALSGLPGRRLAVGLVLGPGVLFGLIGERPVINALAGVAIGGAIIFTVRASLWLYGIVAELSAARNALAQLAVAEERLRFSRDVHDVLGRRLSTIAVQAELAATLAERGDERAADRMLEVRAIAHEALQEARELARGYRPTDLTTELEGARALLRSAGIEAELDVDVVPRAWHEAAGWVVREAVTNVLRHSAAGRVRIGYHDGELRIENDGVTAGPEAGDGSGLHDLHARLRSLGADLEAGAQGGRWTVTARLPATGPLTASTTTETGR